MKTLPLEHLLLFITLINIYSSVFCAQQSDIGLNMSQLIRKYNYPVETHRNVKTADGYLLTLFRIPGGKFSWNETVKDGVRKPVAFLMHGLLGSSYDYITAGGERSLAYLLADKGYDVWLGNARGNVFSRKHVSLNPDLHRKFWRFSWHEIGVYDLPANIDYVLNVTNQTQLSYVGLSQGTTVFYVLCSERPEYNSKIKVMIALAPIVYLSNYRSPILKIVMGYFQQLQILAEVLRVDEILPKPMNQLAALTSRILCQKKGFFQDLCATILSIFGGYDPYQLDKRIMPVVLGNLPAGASVRQLFHYGQLILSGNFQQYDFGRLSNRLKYNSETPPKYNISNIAAPVSLFYAPNDWFGTEVVCSFKKDVRRLAKELPNVKLLYKVPFQYFSHIDFHWATDVVQLVYKRVFKILKTVP